jgi:hypothetical protein
MVQVTDSIGNTARATLGLDIYSALTVVTSALPQATVNAGYSANVAATRWCDSLRLVDGLPSRLSLSSSTCLIGGRPAGGGPASIMVTLTDSNSNVFTAHLKLMVDAALTFTTTSLPVSKCRELIP